MQIPQYGSACPDTRAYVRLRNPTYEHEGLLFTPCACYWDWTEVPYLDSINCEHDHTLCPDCQAIWYEAHNILFVSIRDPRIITDFDELARRWRADHGIPEPPLSDFVR